MLRNGGLNTLRASGLGIPPSLHNPLKSNQAWSYPDFGRENVSESRSMTEKACHLSPPADIPWLTAPLRCLTCWIKLVLSHITAYNFDQKYKCTSMTHFDPEAKLHINRINSDQQKTIYRWALLKYIYFGPITNCSCPYPGTLLIQYITKDYVKDYLTQEEKTTMSRTLFHSMEHIYNYNYCLSLQIWAKGICPTEVMMAYFWA